MDSAVISLIVFGFCIILFIWDRIPMATSAILGCALMVLTGACDFSVAFGQMASGTVLMLIGVTVMGAAISECGLATYIGGAVARFGAKGERVFISVSFICAFLLSAFLTNVTVLAIFIPIVLAVSEKEGGISPLNAVIPVVLAVNAGGVTTLIGSSQQMTAQGLLTEYGYRGLGVFEFAPFGIILGLAALIYVLLVGYPLGKKIWGSRATESGDGTTVPRKNVELDRKKAIAVSVIFAVSLFFYIYQKIPFIGISVPPHLTAVSAAIACIVFGCIGQKRAIECVNWNIVGRLGGCLGLAKALSAAGGIDLISKGTSALFGEGITPFLFFALITLFAQITSLFISNSTAISVTLLIVISVASSQGLNVPAYAMGITLAASMGAGCPLSGSTWGMSMSVGYKFRDYFKYGVMIDLLSYVLILIFVPAFMGLTV